MAKGKIYVGTSGWHYQHWIGKFYPENSNSALQWKYYCKHFRTVEINNSFYKLPPPSVFKKWYDTSPEKMLFAVKANRFITHMLKLTRPEEPIDRLFRSISELREKLGPILFQLPPKWKVNVERLASFLQVLPRNQRYVFEFRNQTWYHEDVYKVLKQYGIAFCIYELAGHISPLKVTTEFVYVRLHGPTAFKYQGSYKKTALRRWAKQFQAWRKDGRDVYVYFDNDENGFAPADALVLKGLLQ